MKVKEYIENYSEDLKNGIINKDKVLYNSALQGLLKQMFVVEYRDLRVARTVTTFDGCVNILKELYQKFMKIIPSTKITDNLYALDEYMFWQVIIDHYKDQSELIYTKITRKLPSDSTEFNKAVENMKN